MKKPKPFQVQGIKALLDNKRFLLSDDVGCGKTIQATLAVYKFKQSVKRINVLVVAPAGLNLQWEKEFLEVFPKACVVHIRDHKDEVTIRGDIRIVICSFNYLQNPVQAVRLTNVTWDIIIVDEAQNLKGWTNKQAKGFRSVIEDHKGYLWFLTATPATSNGEDYYPYFAMIEGQKKWGNLSDFREKYCKKVFDFWSGGFNYLGVKDEKTAELNKAFKRIALRRTKPQVLDELPERVCRTIPVDIDAKTMAACLDVDMDEMLAYLLTDKKLPSHFMSIVRAIGMSKVKPAVDYISQVHEPIVVGCYHIDVVGGISWALEKQGIKNVKYTGETTRRNKEKAVSMFTGGDVDVFICNMGAGGTGLNLQRAAHIVAVEQYWNPGTMMQFFGRIDRMGQKAKCLHVTDFVANCALDQHIVNRREYKAIFMGKVMGDEVWR